MTKTFKNLDNFYNFIHGNCHGEIVGLSVTFQDRGWFVPHAKLHWKRKSSYFPASTNAFHMHRGLCKELRGLSWFVNLTSTRQRVLKKMLFAAIHECYMLNAANNAQGFDVVINVGGAGRAQKVPGLNVFSESYFQIEYFFERTRTSTMTIDNEGDAVVTHFDGVPVDF